MKKIILGSASPRRKELLSQIGVPFEVRVSNKEEVYTNTIPKEIVKELALMKAENVASEIPARNVIVIGADTIVVHEEQILGKPKDEQEAFEMIQSLQGDTHQVYTGVAVLNFDEMPSPDALESSLAFRKEMYQWPGQDSFWVPGHGPSPVQ